MYKLIQIRYWNSREGLVDDIILNELIKQKKVKQFYRPSESRWIDVNKDPVRSKTNNYKGPERRESLKQSKSNKEDSPGWISRLFGKKKAETTYIRSSNDWFEEGFLLLHSSDRHQEAIRAFSSAIALDPTDARAHLNRGLAFERLDNLDQAIADFTQALELSPKDAKILYIRGITYWSQGQEEAAINDLKQAAKMGYQQARAFLASKKIKP